MAKVDWVILCERALIEERAGTMSMVALVENVTVPAPPLEIAKQLFGVPYRFYVVTQWVRAKPKIGERVPARTILKAPHGKKFGLAEYTVDLTVNSKVRLITQSGGFPLAGPGVYSCLVQAKRGASWHTVGQTEFNVIYAPSVIKATRH